MISSASGSSTPFDTPEAASGRSDFFNLCPAGFEDDFGNGLNFFTFGFLAGLEALVLAGFFDEGRAPRRACFLE